ncbi:MAG: phage holin family protein [Thermotogaceae bacterium]|nr:phage holin family protein [Thermotogaceae bacterium]
MNTIWNWLRAAFTGIGAGLGYFLGGCDGFLYALIAFVIIDYLTGVMCAIVDRKLSSSVGFKGIFRKVLIFVTVGIGHTLDTQILGGGSDTLRTAVIFFYCANEGLSLIENAGHLGLPIPEKLKNVFAQLKSRAADTTDKEDNDGKPE